MGYGRRRQYIADSIAAPIALHCIDQHLLSAYSPLPKGLTGMKKGALQTAVRSHMEDGTNADTSDNVSVD
jgi:hypothetical protein